MSELGKIKECDRDPFEYWDCENKVTAVLADRNWSEQARGGLRLIG